MYLAHNGILGIFNDNYYHYLNGTIEWYNPHNITITLYWDNNIYHIATQEKLIFNLVNVFAQSNITKLYKIYYYSLQCTILYNNEIPWSNTVHATKLLLIQQITDAYLLLKIDRQNCNVLRINVQNNDKISCLFFKDKFHIIENKYSFICNFTSVTSKDIFTYIWYGNNPLHYTIFMANSSSVTGTFIPWKYRIESLIDDSYLLTKSITIHQTILILDTFFHEENYHSYLKITNIGLHNPTNLKLSLLNTGQDYVSFSFNSSKIIILASGKSISYNIPYSYITPGNYNMFPYCVNNSNILCSVLANNSKKSDIYLLNYL